MKLYTVSLFALLFAVCSLYGQEILVDSLIKSNTKKMSFDQGEFTGDGWSHIVQNVKNSRNILIGEDHFSNEIPSFVKAVFDQDEFDNFYIEVDPYSTRIIEKTIQDGDYKNSSEWSHRELFSFYALKPEFELLEHVVNSGAGLLGSDQILMYADRLIYENLLGNISNPDATAIYDQIISESKRGLKSFYNNPQQFGSMYMLTPDFEEQLNKLKNLEISELERKIADDLLLSRTIYMTQSHKKRVRLIMNQVLNDLPKWSNGKNLFKYGANHLTRREGFLNVFDIGNLVMNITESNFQESFHLMIVGESGHLGSPLKVIPPRAVDAKNDFYLKFLKPFFEITQDKDWYVFDLLPLRKALYKGDLVIDEKNLERVITGYDVLVIIPEVTAAKFN